MARMTLEQLVTQLRAALGDALQSVVVYGSAARGEQFGDARGVNLLVTVEALDLGRLDAAGAAVRAWMDAGNPAPFILTREEWQRSADIFPMEYADILDRHRVVHGVPPFDGTRVDQADLRRQLEQEAMGKLLHLRAAVLGAGGDGKRQLAILEGSRSAVMVLLRATLRLAGQVPAEDSSEVCRQVATLTGVDTTSFQRAVRHAKGQDAVARSEAGTVLAAYLRGVEQLVEYLDRYAADAR